MSLVDYASRFTKLRVNVARSTSPHKPCMLLAVIDLAEAGALESNKVLYLPNLIERFGEYFDVVRGANDHPNAYFPFFHLRGDRFWKLIPAQGQAAVLQAMKTARSHGDITANISHAELEDELHALLQVPDAREELRDVLIARWFADHANAVWPIVRAHQRANLEESELRERVAGSEAVVRDVEPARSAAFRRLVLEAYDYRCAATGWRIIVPGGASLVEAAHLIPFSVSHNDDPRNGLALTPTFHTALDKNLIAPGPDMKWHVSRIFDKRIPDNRPLIDLDGKDVIYMGHEKYKPAKASVEWRLARLI